MFPENPPFPATPRTTFLQTDQREPGFAVFSTAGSSALFDERMMGNHGRGVKGFVGDFFGRGGRRANGFF
jgi:hypothetical protein